MLSWSFAGMWVNFEFNFHKCCCSTHTIRARISVISFTVFMAIAVSHCNSEQVLCKGFVCRVTYPDMTVVFFLSHTDHPWQQGSTVTDEPRGPRGSHWWSQRWQHDPPGGSEQDQVSEPQPEPHSAEVRGYKLKPLHISGNSMKLVTKG